MHERAGHDVLVREVQDEGQQAQGGDDDVVRARGGLVGGDAHAEGAAGREVHGDGARAGVGPGGHGRGEAHGVHPVGGVADGHRGEGDVEDGCVGGRAGGNAVEVLEVGGEGVRVRAVQVR